MELAAQKKALRRRLRRWRRGLAPSWVAQTSAQVCAAVRALPQWQAANTVLLYRALPGEVQVEALAEGKRACWPVVVGAGQPLLLRGDGPVRRGAFGVLEPTERCPIVLPDEVDLVVVPGLGFDDQGGRLGMGGGYYDRTLAGMRAVRVGVCFAGQRVEAVPRGAHDLRMDAVVSA